jgi:hypothetical protein
MSWFSLPSLNRGNVVPVILNHVPAQREEAQPVLPASGNDTGEQA